MSNCNSQIPPITVEHLVLYKQLNILFKSRSKDACDELISITNRVRNPGQLNREWALKEKSTK